MPKGRVTYTPEFIQSLIGKTFGSVTILSISEPDRAHNSQRQTLVRCQCGEKLTLYIARLLFIGKWACRECARRQRIKHGHTRKGGLATPEYSAWKAMIARCTRPSLPSFKHYGARGISVCDRWLESFQNFIDDMGLRPSSRHSLDRINNNGNYEPNNCRWATPREQQGNTRNTHRIVLNGEPLYVTELARRSGIPVQTLQHRLSRGCTPEQAISKPRWSRYAK